MKAVILVGGSSKGTRFRPLSLELPKPLFPIGDKPMIEHHIEACTKYVHSPSRFCSLMHKIPLHALAYS